MNDGHEIILADPPWHISDYSGHEPGVIHKGTRLPSAHYPTMTVEDICQLQVPAAKNSVLFLWACWPLLPEALQVVKAWGFEYKTLAWVWVKSNKSGVGFFTGMGYYTRANSEPCLLATKGSLGRPVDKGIQALIYSNVREHSRKPDEQYSKIERLYPGKSYLELFARRKRAGWSSWGNEVQSDVLLHNKSIE